MADVVRPYPRSDSTVPEPEPTAVARILKTTLILYPLLLLVVFIGSAAAHSIISSKKEEDIETPDLRGPGGKPLPVTRKRKGVIEDRDYGPEIGPKAQHILKCISLAVFFSFLAHGGAHFAHFVEEYRRVGQEDGWKDTQAMTVYIIGSANLYLYFFITLLEWRRSPSVVHFLTWTLGLIGEFVICLCTFMQIAEYHHIRTYIPPGVLENDPYAKWELVDLIIYAIRLGLMLALVGIYGALWTQNACSRREKIEHGDSDSDTEEASPLLNGSHPTYNTQNGREANGRSMRGVRNGDAIGNTNGTVERSSLHKEESAAFYRPEKLPHKTWWEYLRGYSLFFPYLWPKDSLRLKGIVAVCFVLVVAQRVVNMLVPLQVGKVADSLEKGEAPWLILGLFIFYRLLQGPSMLLGAIRSMLWVPVSQYSYRALTTSAFEHVHSLSLDFHLGKRTGEVLSALNKGASINQFLEQVTFQVLPMLFDLVIAVYFFYYRFDATFAVIVSCISFWYLYLTVRMAQTRADQRREMTNADREEEAVKNDSITSYETVKYFNAERWEFDRYRNAIRVFQEAEAKVTWGMNKMNIIQALVFMCGLMVVLLLGAYQVTTGHKTVGDFVTLMTYLNQLQGPLNFFGTFYRTIQQAMISGERLLELFKIRPTVVDAPGVKPLAECNGFIRWNNVAFSYDHRIRALRNLDFTCSPGTTTAFVGESGGGKSTVFRLMFRYYNTTDGSIEIDGHDVKDLTIDSVRRYIGVVPQDTNLFNETLMYNLKYANPEATDKDVEDACRAASIHDRIMSFPDQYNTKVGDRGMRLSGGERQRVAIARTILKNPKIIMLDEATSALDAHTEQEIQDKLGNLGQGRTLLIIAHRLSTITHADQIIVLNNGTIAEKGTHEELVNANGRYASMWEKQVQAERAAEKARVASRKAQKLMRKANIAVAKKKEGSSDGYNSLASSTILPGGTGGHGSPNNRSVEDSSSSASSSNSSDTESTHTLHCESERH